MAGSLYLGSQKVCPAVVFGSEQKDCLFRVPDNVTSLTTESAFSMKFDSFPYPISVDLNGLETINADRAFLGSFGECSIPKLDVSSIKTIEGVNVFNGTFISAVIGEMKLFENLEEVNGRSCFALLFSRSNISGVVHFPKLKHITSSDGYPDGTFTRTFEFTSVTDIYFDVLTNRDLSPQQQYVFYDMLYGVDGCTVHFPSNLASTVGIYLEVVSGMGGTNTTVLFDLPASEE